MTTRQRVVDDFSLLFFQFTREQWQKVFYISSAITAFGGIFFLIFGSGEEQSWCHTPKEDGDSISDSENSILINS